MSSNFVMKQARQFGCVDSEGPRDIVERIQKKLEETFNGEFDHVNVQSPDAMNQQVHVFVISDQFKGKLPLARHRIINDMIKEEIKEIHAINIEAKTVDQYVGK